ncbi:Peptidyl-prolyl cis-trans isomerase CYP28, chloroplastic [Senna tora]|uniref:Peptidyl-prolyl cis-trans isomerase CYP28, chloroplastic n=1 Tax=Senna tora TaxID=362788 RepID=A0A835CDK4_9FABA|nr:Peptidyl-prolyl cis-trans isomerase CYP28, chloroplastic [Senna tora]
MTSWFDGSYGCDDVQTCNESQQDMSMAIAPASIAQECNYQISVEATECNEDMFTFWGLKNAGRPLDLSIQVETAKGDEKFCKYFKSIPCGISNWVELKLIFIVVLRQRKRENPGLRMRKRKCPRIDSFCVARQIQRRLNLAPVSPSLAAGKEVLAWEDFVNEGVLVGRAGRSNAHGLEVRNRDGYEVTVQAEDNAAYRDGIGAEGLNVVAEGSAGEEVVRAEAEIHEDAVGDGGVRRCLGGFNGGGGK